MKKLVAALAIGVILLSARVSQAADLQEGWYVKLGMVTLWGFDYGINFYTGTDWDFTNNIGQYDEFMVTNPDSIWPERLISVTTSQFNVPCGTGITLSGTPRNALAYDITRIDVTCETYYEAEHLQLQAWLERTDGAQELLWSQQISGYVYGTAELLGGNKIMAPEDVLYFRLSTGVPEPQSFVIVAYSLIAVGWRRRQGK